LRKESADMKKWTVHFMTAALTWEGVEAETDSEAIAKCGVPCIFDANEPQSFIATEEEQED